MEIERLCVVTDGLWLATLTNWLMRGSVPHKFTTGGIFEIFRQVRLALTLV